MSSTDPFETTLRIVIVGEGGLIIGSGGNFFSNLLGRGVNYSFLSYFFIHLMIYAQNVPNLGQNFLNFVIYSPYFYVQESKYQVNKWIPGCLYKPAVSGLK